MIYASAPGKINLHFEVGPRRQDGYHSVISLYQALALRQRVGVELAERWSVQTTGNIPEQQILAVPADETNLMVVAAKQLAQFVGIDNPQPIRFFSEKQVPVAAGLAGGSADAAAALVALNEAWCLGLDIQDLLSVAATVGSDVPFAIMGGVALGTDTGISLKSLEPRGQLHIVLVVSPLGLSTAEVFEKFDQLFPTGDLSQSAADVMLRYASGDLEFGRNSLLEPALSLRPELAPLMQSCSKPLSLSGSGPTLFFASYDRSEVDACAKELTGKGLVVIQTQSDDRGAELD